MYEITLNPTYILTAAYAVVKVFLSVWICKHEFRYPIWNREGIQIPRGIQQKVQSFLRNWAINPEWGLLKAIAFVPVFLATGKRFIHAFLPWRVQKTPPFCTECNDKGKYYVRSFDGNGGHWRVCSCKRVKVPQEVPDCSCPVCLDQGTIGKNRPCPHCERRGVFVRHAQAEVKRSKIENPELCKGCGNEVDFRKMRLITGGFFCPACLCADAAADAAAKVVKDAKDAKVAVAKVVAAKVAAAKDHPWHKDKCTRCGGLASGGRLCSDCYLASYAIADATTYSFYPVADKAPNGNERTLDPKPLRYLETPDSFCGDQYNETECDNWHDRRWLKKKQPTELHVGDTILIRSIQTGHRDQWYIGKPLRILGLNLPFAVVEYDTNTAGSSSRHIDTVNLRGMTIYGERDGSAIKSTLAYQPLLDPTALRVGDMFVLLNLRENGTDSSWRGEAFRVTKPAFRLTEKSSCIPKGALVVECEHLSFHKFDTPTLMNCERLMILPVNVQYVQATKAHCPDIGYA